jgi:tetratricopeptide (TPR) repeat protein
VSLYWQGRYAEAETAFAHAIGLKPDYIRAHCDLGEMLAEQRRLAESEAAYQRALVLDPNCVTAHAALAGLFLTESRLEEAEHHCREALRTDPALARAHFTLWEILERQGKYADLEAAALAVLALRPNHVDARARLSRARALRPRLAKPV